MTCDNVLYNFWKHISWTSGFISFGSRLVKRAGTLDRETSDININIYISDIGQNEIDKHFEKRMWYNDIWITNYIFSLSSLEVILRVELWKDIITYTHGGVDGVRRYIISSYTWWR